MFTVNFIAHFAINKRCTCQAEPYQQAAYKDNPSFRINRHSMPDSRNRQRPTEQNQRQYMPNHRNCHFGSSYGCLCIHGTCHPLFLRDLLVPTTLHLQHIHTPVRLINFNHNTDEKSRHPHSPYNKKDGHIPHSQKANHCSNDKMPAIKNLHP